MFSETTLYKNLPSCAAALKTIELFSVLCSQGSVTDVVVARCLSPARQAGEAASSGGGAAGCDMDMGGYLRGFVEVSVTQGRRGPAM